MVDHKAQVPYLDRWRHRKKCQCSSSAKSHRLQIQEVTRLQFCLNAGRAEDKLKALRKSQLSLGALDLTGF